MLLVHVQLSSDVREGDAGLLQQHIHEALQKIFIRYGIKAELQTELSVDYIEEQRAAIIYINGEEIECVPFYLAGDAWFFAQGKHIEKNNSEHEAIDEILAKSDEELKSKFAVDYVCEAVKQNIPALVTDDFVSKIRDDLQLQSLDEGDKKIKTVLQTVLQHHISVNKFYPRIRELQTKSVAVLAEEIIASTRTAELSIAFSSKYLVDLMSSYNDGENDFYRLVDEAMFYELGIDFPGVNFIADDSIPYAWFKIFVNDYESRLYKGLNPGEAIIQKNDESALPSTAEKIGVIIHPANGNECWLFSDGELQNTIPAQVWRPFAFMGLHLVYFYRHNANLFLDFPLYKKIMSEVNGMHPALAACVQSKTDDYFMCSILRSLIEERISLRNIISICQSVIDFDYIVADGVNKIVFDERLTTLAEPSAEWLNSPHNYADFARLNLKDYISSSVTGNSLSLSVFLINHDAENYLAANSEFSNNYIKNLLLAIEDAVIENTNIMYPILTTVEARKKLWRIIQRRFTGMRVLSYQELSPSTSITTVKRISIKDEPV